MNHTFLAAYSTISKYITLTKFALHTAWLSEDEITLHANNAVVASHSSGMTDF